MMTIERILLTTNLTPHSDRATERAVQLALQFGADLSVLYAIQPAAGQPASPYDRLSAHDIEAEMRRHVMAVPAAAALSPFVSALRGPVEEVAASYAESWKASLLVAGVHRGDSLRDLFAVTTVERISVASEVPLLVVRNKPFRPYASALVPVDLREASRPGIAAALSLIPQGSVSLLHILDIPGAAGSPAPTADELQAEFAALLDGMAVGQQAIGTSVRHGPTMREIVEAAHADMPDLLVMGTAARRGFGRALIGSTAHEVLEHLPSDVLLVRAP